MLDKAGRIALEKRPEKGLLGGMVQVPTSDWVGEAFDVAQAATLAPAKAKWRRLDGNVTHVFTHFALHLTVLAATGVKADARYQWVAIDNLGKVALPSVMRKVVEHAVAKLV
jgi:A/G-specific adenine glycosylase